MQQTRMAGSWDSLEWLSRRITQLAFLVAFIVAVAAPLLAIQWSNRPFLGFLVEQTLASNNMSGNNWSPQVAGIEPQERVLRVAGNAVSTPSELYAIISQHQVGDTISLLTQLPSGALRLHPSITLQRFPSSDMVSFFVVPYLIGLAYLAVAFWIYRVKGQTRPGRALAFFCICTAIVCALIFDITTTHAGSAVYTVAIAMLGGTLISLALRFPKEWHAVTRRPWLLVVPYGISIALATWGLLVLNNTAQPWAYIGAWGASYRFTALGVFMFLGIMLYHAYTSESPVAQQQARIVLFGSALAFAPMLVWLVAPVFNVRLPFIAVLYLPGLLVFPVAVAVAILRYRLLEMDLIVNRTIVYGALTAILAGAFTASTLLSRYVFVALTGETSDAAIVLTTLIVASAFTPLKSRLQAFVDGQFKQIPDNVRNLRGFGDEVSAFMRMSDPGQITKRLLEESVRALHARSGAISLVIDGRLQTIHTHGPWRGDAWASLPLECEGERFGLLSLGAREDERQYSLREVEALQQVVQQVACAVRLALAFRALPSLLDNGTERKGERPVRVGPANSRRHIHARYSPDAKL